MANLLVALRAEMEKASRKEVRRATAGMRKTITRLAGEVAALKKTIKAHRRGAGLQRKPDASAPRPALPEVSEKTATRMRPTGRMVMGLRKKYGLTQRQFAELVGVSLPLVALWERTPGRLSMRAGTMVKLAAVRGLGKRQVAAMVPSSKRKPRLT